MHGSSHKAGLWLVRGRLRVGNLRRRTPERRRQDTQDTCHPCGRLSRVAVCGGLLDRPRLYRELWAAVSSRAPGGRLAEIRFRLLGPGSGPVLFRPFPEPGPASRAMAGVPPFRWHMDMGGPDKLPLAELP